MSMNVTLSPQAADEVKRMIKSQCLPESTLLRVGVVGGGCSGYEYRLEFAEKADEEDDILGESSGLKIAVDKRSARLLDGIRIDIGDGLNNRGFIFSNPMAVRTCGCGTSFEV